MFQYWKRQNKVIKKIHYTWLVGKYTVVENLEIAADPVWAHPAAVEVELAQPVTSNLYSAVQGQVISPDFTPNPFLDYWEGLQIRPAAPGYIIIPLR